MSCQNEPKDDRPIGSTPPDDTCSPCAVPDPSSLADQLQAVKDKNCALEAQMNAWYILLNKVRNRLSAAEGAIANFPKIQSQTVIGGTTDSCEDLIDSDVADSLTACNEGEKVKIPAGDEITRLTSCGGKWKADTKGKLFYPFATPINTQVTCTAGTVNGEVDYSAQMPEEFEDCAEDIFVAMCIHGECRRSGSHDSPVIYLEYSVDGGATWLILAETNQPQLYGDGTGSGGIFRLKDKKFKYRARNIHGNGSGRYNLVATGLFL